MTRPSAELWRIEVGLQASGPSIILPDGRLDLVLWYRPSLEGRGLEDVRLVVSGTNAKPLAVQCDPGTVFHGIRFRPGWGAAALGLASDEIGQQPVAAAVFGGWMRRLACDLANCRSDQIAPLLIAFAKQARDRAAVFLRAHPARHRAIIALDWLERHPSRAVLRPLARHLEISQRSLRRDIVSLTGLSPQTLAGIFRARYALTLLQTNPHQPLADLALASFYADQADMSRALRELTGHTPAFWRNSGRLLQDNAEAVQENDHLLLT